MRALECVRSHTGAAWEGGTGTADDWHTESMILGVTEGATIAGTCVRVNINIRCVAGEAYPGAGLLLMLLRGGGRAAED